jgi:hypothetical protein
MFGIKSPAVEYANYKLSFCKRLISEKSRLEVTRGGEG